MNNEKSKKYPVIITKLDFLKEHFLEHTGIEEATGNSEHTSCQIEVTGYFTVDEFRRIVGDEADIRNYLSIRTEGPEGWDINFGIVEAMANEATRVTWQDVLIEVLMAREGMPGANYDKIKHMALPMEEITPDNAAALVHMGHITTDNPQEVDQVIVLEEADKFGLELKDLARV